jgi:SAM-dependent methyltransferase
MFDEEMSLLYAKMADNHRHPNGPWPLLTDFVVNSAKSSTSNQFRVLDLASGPGEPAKSIAIALPHAQVYSTDISEPMVMIASKIDLPNFSASLADMQNLSNFESNYFDVVTCCYGFMFPPDKERALKETLRVLKPGGILFATTWDNLPILDLANGIMQGVLGVTPPPPPLNPMSLSAPGLFQSMLENTGFNEVVSHQRTYPFDMGKDSEVQFKMSTLLLKDKLTELNQWPKAKSVYDSIINKHASVDSSGSMTVEGNTFKFTVAKKP